MHRPHILVVDDDPMICELVSRNLRAEQYVVTTASDGAAGLAALKRDTPDLVLLDTSMPDRDSTELAQRVHDLSDARQVPIIFMTVLGGDGSERPAEAGEVDDFVTKPFSPDMLRFRIRTALDRMAS